MTTATTRRSDCPAACPNTDHGTCPLCFEAQHVGCPHGDPCPECSVGLSAEEIAHRAAGARAARGVAVVSHGYVLGLGWDDGAAQVNADANAAKLGYASASAFAARHGASDDMHVLPATLLAVLSWQACRVPTEPAETPPANATRLRIHRGVVGVRAFAVVQDVGEGPSIMGLGLSPEDARAQAECLAPGGTYNARRPSRCVAATDAALAAWSGGSPDDLDIARDGTVRRVEELEADDEGYFHAISEGADDEDPFEADLARLPQNIADLVREAPHDPPADEATMLRAVAYYCGGGDFVEDAPEPAVTAWLYAEDLVEYDGSGFGATMSREDMVRAVREVLPPESKA
jgi:hypothetical protein